MLEGFEEIQKYIGEQEEKAKTDRIEVDSPFAKQIGFTSDRFDGYLWKEGKFISISFIISKQQGRGNLTKLFKNINKQGYKIEVPTPFPNMELILKCHGFKKTIVSDPLMGKVEVWKQQGLKWKRDYKVIQKIISINTS